MARAAMIVYLNYLLLLECVVLCAGWFMAGDVKQGLYWLGATIVNAAVTFKFDS